MKKIILSIALVLLFSSVAQARTSGYYIGGGYQQPLNFTWKEQATSTEKVRMWPGFGGFIVGGYDFERPDWLGIAVPLNVNYIKLNRSEWVMLFNADAEVIFHLMDESSKFDPFVSLLAGFNYMTEGKVSDETASMGPSMGASFGLRYTLSESAYAGSTHVSNLSLFFEVPVKVTLFLNDEDVSKSKTLPIISVPVRAGITYTF